MNTPTKQPNQAQPEKEFYDYDKQCWVVDGLVQSCAHPESMNCGCYGKLRAGENLETK